jgi:hypothetical protein
MVQSPTHALRLLLPVDQGGVDRLQRLQALEDQTVPAPVLLQAFADAKIPLTELPPDAQQKFMGLAGSVWQDYLVVPASELIRGRLDDCTRQIVRMQKAAEEAADTFNPASFAKWRDKVRKIYLTEDPIQITQLWDEDLWLSQFLRATDEEPGGVKDNRPGQPEELASPKAVRKGIVSSTLLAALSAPARRQCNYLLALRWQEKAERMQARANSIMAGKANAAGKAAANQDALDAWNNAAVCWAAYANDNPLTVATLRGHTKTVEAYAKAGRVPLANALGRHYAWLIRQGASGRVMQAHALEKSGRPDAARTALQKLATELEALDKELKLGKAAGLFWPRYTALLEMKKLEGGKRGE